MHKVISIECIIAGLPILQDFEDELLPIVALIWHPFVQRFKEKDTIVLTRCFSLLEVLAVHAKDFVLQRTLNDVFPLLCNFLVESSKNSFKKTYLVETFLIIQYYRDMPFDRHSPFKLQVLPFRILNGRPSGNLCREKKLSVCGRSVVVGDEDGSVHICNLEDMPFPSYFQFNELRSAVFKALVANPELTRQLENLGFLGYPNGNRNSDT